MTDKLKTLNEIEFSKEMEPLPRLMCYSGELRNEAIRHVNRIDKDVKYGAIVYGIFGGDFMSPELKVIRQYIMWQNNLTEEDLK